MVIKLFWNNYSYRIQTKAEDTVMEAVIWSSYQYSRKRFYYLLPWTHLLRLPVYLSHQMLQLEEFSGLGYQEA